MPGLDGQGPQGEGPMTGRQMGNCPQAKPYMPFMRQKMGRRFSAFSTRQRPRCRGYHWGIGAGYGYDKSTYEADANYSPEEEKRILKEHKDILENQLEKINMKIENLKD